MESLKGKFLEVHLDLGNWVGNKGMWDDHGVEVVRVEKTRTGKDYPVVNAVVAGDDERGISIVCPASGTQFTCITPDLVYGTKGADKMMEYVRDCVRKGVYRFSDSEIFYGEIKTLEDAEVSGFVATCPFAGGGR